MFIKNELVSGFNTDNQGVTKQVFGRFLAFLNKKNHDPFYKVSWLLFCYYEPKLQTSCSWDIEHLPEEDKAHLFYVIDNLIKAVKLKSIA